MAQAHPVPRRRTARRSEKPADQETGITVAEPPSADRPRAFDWRFNPEGAATSPVAVTDTEPTKKRTRGNRGGRGRKKPDAPVTGAAETPTSVVTVETPKRARSKAPVETKPAAQKSPARSRSRTRTPEPPAAYDDAVVTEAPQITSVTARPRIPVTGAPVDVPAPFAHNAEYEFARILDFYGIEWQYEPRSFPLRWERGHVTEAFTPDFYLTDLELFVELTTLKSGLTAEKNRKMRELQELYPDTRIIMLKKRDYLRLLAKYGYGAISPDQVPDIDRVLVPTTKLQARVAELGEQISKDYAGKEPVLVGVLRGVMCFIADLMRQISLPTSVDFMAVSSYDGSTATAVRILKDLDLTIKGRDVILVEDIVDTGMTVRHVLEYLRTKRPASLKVCTLLNKPARRLVDIPIDYTGFEIADEFVVGYGLDFQQRFRNLPFIGTLKHELLP